jgi:hypothetical protein
MTGFEGIGDFDSNDPYERHIAHQAAKGHSHKPPMFTQGHYNILAKEIRERLDAALSFNDNWSNLEGYDKSGRYYATEALVVLALNLTKRFKADNPRFKPEMFLDACSPNVDLYPLSELYEEEDASSRS